MGRYKRNSASTSREREVYRRAEQKEIRGGDDDAHWERMLKVFTKERINEMLQINSREKFMDYCLRYNITL